VLNPPPLDLKTFKSMREGQRLRREMIVAEDKEEDHAMIRDIRDHEIGQFNHGLATKREDIIGT
jgi:hypothetical protein